MEEVYKQYGSRRPPSLEAVLAKMQIDPTLFNMIGGWKTVYKYGPPNIFKHYENYNYEIK